MREDLVVRCDDVAGVRSETAWCAVPEKLRPYVRTWLGYSERTPSRARRRELPRAEIVLIVEFGPAIRVSERGEDTCTSRFEGGFIAGLDDCFSITEHDGHQAGIQLSLTPRGARAVLGVPLHAIARRVVALPDVLPAHRSLAERLAETTSWASRFAIVEEMLVARLGLASPMCGTVAWATDRIEQTGGLVRVADLCAQTGYSRKHLAKLFHEHVGLPPKLYAEIVRFERLTQRLATREDTSWSRLAFELGFSDQAHLAREVRRFSGVSPTEARLLVCPHASTTNI